MPNELYTNQLYAPAGGRAKASNRADVSAEVSGTSEERERQLTSSECILNCDFQIDGC